MDISKDLVLKENFTFLVADETGGVREGEHGFYNRDTRFLNRYLWELPEGFQTLLAYSSKPEHFYAHYGLIDGPSQNVGIRRLLQLSAVMLKDNLTIENTSADTQSFSLSLRFGSDFADMFEARGWFQDERVVEVETSDKGITFSYNAKDGITQRVEISLSHTPTELDKEGMRLELSLAPRETVNFLVEVKIANPLERLHEGISYEDWTPRFTVRPERKRHQEVFDQAVADLRALLLFTDYGVIPAAGIPWFVTAFGRDSLLTAYMMLPWGAEVAKGTLRYLAAYQGTENNDFRAENPGKIMHEIRFGELARTGKVPHSPYYGTIDATSLFVMLLQETWKTTGDFALVQELRPNWEAALRWMVEDGDLDGDGFLEFRGREGVGLAVQSWKDSGDSMSHADGKLAEGALAVSEVQGYAYAAYLAGAEFYEELGEGDKANTWQERAATLKAKFHEAFWLEDLQTYAMALDGNKEPLRVQNSDAGQVLWTGIVPDDIAPKLVKTLMSAELWSGWGIRTLGSNETRYNPVSYHNGSVWPHDTALAAGGMARYGFKEEAAKIREALYALAATQRDKRLPELVAGYERTDAPPVPYPVACRPQAWDAAALIYLLRL